MLQDRNSVKIGSLLLGVKFKPYLDYGLPRLYDAQKLEDEKFGNEKPEDLLWTAPELLKDEHLRKTGTQVNKYLHIRNIINVSHRVKMKR